jgi:hypothetical protein
MAVWIKAMGEPHEQKTENSNGYFSNVHLSNPIMLWRFHVGSKANL